MLWVEDWKAHNIKLLQFSLVESFLLRRLKSFSKCMICHLTRGSLLTSSGTLCSYFDNMNLSLSILDPVLYTAQRTFYRSPFLFTVSKYHDA